MLIFQDIIPHKLINKCLIACWAYENKQDKKMFSTL